MQMNFAAPVCNRSLERQVSGLRFRLVTRRSGAPATTPSPGIHPDNCRGRTGAWALLAIGFPKEPYVKGFTVSQSLELRLYTMQLPQAKQQQLWRRQRRHLKPRPSLGNEGLGSSSRCEMQVLSYKIQKYLAQDRWICCEVVLRRCVGFTTSKWCGRGTRDLGSGIFNFRQSVSSDAGAAGQGRQSRRPPVTPRNGVIGQHGGFQVQM